METLPTLVLNHLAAQLDDPKDMVALGDTCRGLRDTMADVLKQKRDAYLARFRDPDAKWDFKAMWRMPYEILRELPVEQKPPLYKQVSSPRVPLRGGRNGIGGSKGGGFGDVPVGLDGAVPADAVGLYMDTLGRLSVG